MKDQNDNVELTAVETGISEVFTASHAERILSYDVKIGKQNWVLTDKKMKFEDGKISTGKSKGTDNQS